MESAVPVEEPDGGFSGHSTRLVHFATITSRVEAFVMRSVLEDHGIHVWLGAEHHAGVEFISEALGGYRLEIFEADLIVASDLARELDWLDGEIIYEGQQQAVQRLLAVVFGVLIFFGIPAMIQGAMSLGVFLLAALNIPTALPVDPRGPNEFHLADGEATAA